MHMTNKRSDLTFNAVEDPWLGTGAKAVAELIERAEKTVVNFIFGSVVCLFAYELWEQEI